MAWEENGQLYGKCPECDDCGPIGGFCELCSDFSVLYERMKDYEAEVERERFCRRARPLLERIFEAFVELRNEPYRELELFFAIVADELTKRKRFYEPYIALREEEMMDFKSPICNVQDIMNNLYRVFVEQFCDYYGDAYEMHWTEKEAICRVGTLWVQHLHLKND